MAARFVELFRLELPDTFPAAADVVDQAGAQKHVKMLANGLASYYRMLA